MQFYYVEPACSLIHLKHLKVSTMLRPPEGNVSRISPRIFRVCAGIASAMIETLYLIRGLEEWLYLYCTIADSRSLKLYLFLFPIFCWRQGEGWRHTKSFRQNTTTSRTWSSFDYLKLWFKMNRPEEFLACDCELLEVERSWGLGLEVGWGCLLLLRY